MKAARRGLPLLWIIRYLVVWKYLKGHATRKIHIGSQMHILEGWLNTEYEAATYWSQIFLDARKRFPFSSESVDYIFTEHMIEHIEYSDAAAMLSECYRVLRKGGAIRVATPDLGRLMRLYTCADAPDVQAYINWSAERHALPRQDAMGCIVLNHFMHSWGHRFIFDADTLSNLLRGAGFTQIRHCRPGESPNPILSNLESHGESIGKDMNAFETMVLEARKL